MSQLNLETSEQHKQGTTFSLGFYVPSTVNCNEERTLHLESPKMSL